MTIVEFLLARIAEDEAEARLEIAEWNASAPSAYDLAQVPSSSWSPERMLAECEAKRRIVALHDEGRDGPCQSDAGNYLYEPCDTIRALAAVYADHPDYREEWRP